jgi:hypothetical protein
MVHEHSLRVRAGGSCVLLAGAGEEVGSGYRR